MAHRLLVQVVLTGAKVFGRAFTEAYRQAAAATTVQQATQQGAKAASAHAPSGVRSRDTDISLDESCKILDVEPSVLSLESARQKYDYLFDINSKEKGGSFYIQSKVYRAMERIQKELDYLAEFKKAQERAEGEQKGSPDK